MALCEAACYAKSQGKTLWDMMIDIYKNMDITRKHKFQLSEKEQKELKKFKI